MYEEKKEKRKKEIKEWAASIAIMLILVFIVKTFIFGTVLVKGNSMWPTLGHNDFVFISKIEYVIGNPEAGDIIVCEYDKGVEKENIVKRVIGMPGDVIDLKMNENYEYVVLVNSVEIDEPYLAEAVIQPGDVVYPYTVPEGSYFVMGDNRNSSNDSRNRTIGAVGKDMIFGKVVLRVYPVDSISVF